MKIFIAYKFSGTDSSKLKEILSNISQSLKENGHESFIFYRDVENWGETELSSKEIINSALEKLRECDAILAFIDTPEKSEGLLLEAGFAKALGKKLHLLIKRNTRAVFLRDIADIILEFDSTEELPCLIKKL